MHRGAWRGCTRAGHDVQLPSELERKRSDPPHDGHSAISSATAWCGRMTRKNSLWFFPSFESLASMPSGCHVAGQRGHQFRPELCREKVHSPELSDQQRESDLALGW